MKIAIVGNCQARPLAQLISIMQPQVEVNTIAIVHLLRDSEEGQYATAFSEADFIYAQKVSDIYQCKFVRTNELKKKYGDKVITWINLYYAGYNPELISMKSATRAPLKGPLGDYHSEIIIKGYQESMTPEACVELMFDVEYNRERYAGVPPASLDGLAERESDTNVRIAGFISEHQATERLFYTFNHPATRLLIETARQMLEYAELKIARDIDPHCTTETLSTIVAPVNPYSRQSMAIAFKCGNTFKGQDVNVGSDGVISYGRSCLYSPVEIVERFYKVYDTCSDLIRKQAVT